jgi:DNA-binding response OmpR family regulator
MMRILILDADPRTRIVWDYLTTEYQVKIAADGSYIDTILGFKPDILILDAMLPHVNVVRMIRTIRTHADISNLGIILVSRRTMKSDIVTGLEAGADDYMVKPVHKDEIRARVDALSRRVNKTYGKDHLIEGDLCIDVSAHQVYLAGQPVRLSKMRFALLVFLVRCKGRSFTREEILLSVWGHTNLTTGNVTVTMYGLRKAIEVDPANPVRLVTVTNKRYMFQG